VSIGSGGIPRSRAGSLVSREFATTAEGGAACMGGAWLRYAAGEP